MVESNEMQQIGLGPTYTHVQTWGDAERGETWYWKWSPEQRAVIVTRNGELLAAVASVDLLEQLDLPEEMRLLLTLYLEKREAS